MKQKVTVINERCLNFISGVLTEPMGREIGYGDFTCYLTSNETLSDISNQTKEDCKAFKTEFE